MLGTLYPLFLDAMNLGKISVGPPYFESVFVPLMAPLVFLIGVGPMARWKQATLPDLATRLKWALAVAIVSAAMLPFVLGSWKPLVAFGLFLAFWVLAASAANLIGRVRQTAVQGKTLFQRLRSIPRSYYGMLLAHCGVAVFIIGVTLVKGYETEKDVRMAPGDSVELGGYAFRFGGVKDTQGPNYVAARATLYVTREGHAVATLHPERRVYRVQESPMTESDIDYGLFRHLYVALSESVGPDAWIVRLQYKPFIGWIWCGCLLMALGGLLAASDRRYRLAAREPRPAPQAAAAGTAR